MKRLISIMLCIMMIASAANVFAAEATEKTYDESARYRAKLLYSLGVFDNSVLKTDELNKSLTRLEFAKYLASLIGADKAKLTQDVYFTDIDEVYVNNLAALEIISGDGSGAFNPYASVSSDEALMMSVRALGYRKYAEAQKSGVSAYVKLASRLDLETPASGGVTLAESINLMYSMLDVTMMQVSSVYYEGDEAQSTYNDKNGESFLEYYRDCALIEGQLTANFLASIRNVSGLTREQVAVNDKVYTTSDEDAFKFIGQNVAAIYDIKGDKLLGVAADPSEMTSLVLDADEIVGFKNNTLTYQKDGTTKEKSVKLDYKKLNVIYNGKTASKNFDDLFDIKLGTVSLYATDGGNKYDVAVIEEYVDVKVKQYSTDTFTVYTDGSGDFAQLKFDEIEDKSAYRKIFSAQSGLTIAARSFVEDDVLSVCMSDDKSYLVVYVCTESVSGTVSSVSTKNGTKYVTINDESYKISPYYKGLEIANGKEGNFILDKFGRIANVKKYTESDSKIAYLYGIKKPGGSLDSNVSIKIYTDTKEHLVYELANKVNFNGETMSEASVYDKLYNGTKLDKCLIKYRVNSEGLVTFIDTGCGITYFDEITNGAETLTVNYERLGDNGEYVLKYESLVFMVPSASDDESPENFNVVKFRRAMTPTIVNQSEFRLYRDSTDPFVDYTLYFFNSKNSPSDQSAFGAMMVDTIKTVRSENGDTYKVVDGFSNNLPLSITVRSDVMVRTTLTEANNTYGFDAVEQGDWILYSTNAMGQVGRIIVMYNADCDPFNSTYPNAHTPYRAWGGESGYNYNDWDVLKVERGVYGGNQALLVLGDAATGEIRDILVLDESKAEFTVYDSTLREGNVYVGSLDDVTSYESTNGARYDRLCYNFRDSSTLMNMALYK